MEEIPDTWPPPDQVLPVVPVFPLKSLWLYPRVLLPLHIFEPRYRQMIEDSLDGPGRLVIGTIQEGHDEQEGAAPPIYGVAGLGEITQHERLPDGRFKIMLAGLFRVRLEEVPSDRLYRKARVERLFETDPHDAGDAGGADLREQLRVAIQGAGVKLDREVVDKLPIGSLADVLTARLEAETPEKQELFELLDTGERARAALRSFQGNPPQGDPPETGPSDEA